MATPNWESEGLSRHSQVLVLWSKRVLPPWDSSGILADEMMGASALISWVSGPIIPTTFWAARSWRSAGTESASSHWVSAWARFSCLPRMPPASLIAFWATWEPCNMASPRLARVPVKQDRTPIVTETPPELEVEFEPPHAASVSMSTRQPDTIRRDPCRPLLDP